MRHRSNLFRRVVAYWNSWVRPGECASLTIVGAVRDTPVVARRERASPYSARIALHAPARGRSASPLELECSWSAHWPLFSRCQRSSPLRYPWRHGIRLSTWSRAVRTESPATRCTLASLRFFSAGARSGVRARYSSMRCYSWSASTCAFFCLRSHGRHGTLGQSGTPTELGCGGGSFSAVVHSTSYNRWGRHVKELCIRGADARRQPAPALSGASGRPLNFTVRRQCW